MPFPRIARDNLAAALSFANLFTDEGGQYLTLTAQIAIMREVDRFFIWQVHHPYQAGSAGRSSIKRALLGYTSLESTIDLFMLYSNIPPCKTHSNLAYLNENVQKLIYHHFKETVLRKALLDRFYPSATAVEQAIRSQIRKIVQGYAKKLPEQSHEEWQIFVAEVDIGIERLSKQYGGILSAAHVQFSDFRKGQLSYLKNYFDRCFFLARLEKWLTQVPFEKPWHRVENAKVSQFCERLLKLEQSYEESDLHDFNQQLMEIQRYTVSQEQQKTILTALIRLKPKYDAYRAGQINLNDAEQLKVFMDAWPKPTLPRFVPLVRNKERDEAWNNFRVKQREKEAKREDEPLSLKHKQSFGKRALLPNT